MRDRWDELQNEAERVAVLEDAGSGIPVGDGVRRLFPHIVPHDPTDLGRGRHLATGAEGIPMGLLYRNPDSPRYDQVTTQGLGMSADDKLRAMSAELDRFAL